MTISPFFLNACDFSISGTTIDRKLSPSAICCGVGPGLVGDAVVGEIRVQRRMHVVILVRRDPVEFGDRVVCEIGRELLQRRVVLRLVLSEVGCFRRWWR